MVLKDLQDLLRWNGFEVAASYGRNFIGRRSEALSFLPDFSTTFSRLRHSAHSNLSLLPLYIKKDNTGTTPINRDHSLPEHR